MIIIDLNGAKEIGHTIRRERRGEEFKPLDQAIILQVPGTDFVAVEAERQLIRDKYAVIQEQIAAATTVEEIKIALGI